MRIFGVIPARGGSKGVPRKNVRLLCGRPLLEYTAAAALAAGSLAHVIVSTDDEEIAEVARRCGLDVPFLRPPALAQDDTPMLPVVQHAMTWAETTGVRYDAVCILQPTNPLRGAEEIDACAELLERSGADCVVTVLRVPAEYNPHWVYFQAADGSLRLSTGEHSPIPRRQELPPAVHREGSVYMTRWDVVMTRQSLYGTSIVGYTVEPERSVNIDGPEDWAQAERLMREALVNRS